MTSLLWSLVSPQSCLCTLEKYHLCAYSKVAKKLKNIKLAKSLPFVNVVPISVAWHPQCKLCKFYDVECWWGNSGNDVWYDFEQLKFMERKKKMYCNICHDVGAGGSTNHHFGDRNSEQAVCTITKPHLFSFSEHLISSSGQFPFPPQHQLPTQLRWTGVRYCTYVIPAGLGPFGITNTAFE